MLEVYAFLKSNVSIDIRHDTGAGIKGGIKYEEMGILEMKK